MRLIYLHGFASGPLSRKAQAFRSGLVTEQNQLEIPDLAQSDFEHLTISGQLRVIENLLRGEPCRLVGSSMGGYLAALYAAKHPEVDRLVLLAPAFGFAARWREMQTPSIERWKETNWIEVYHYGEKAIRRVHYELLEDARRFVASHPNAELRELESDHELLDALPAITEESIRFLTETR